MKKDTMNKHFNETKWLVRIGFVTSLSSLLSCVVPLILFLLGISREWMMHLITLDSFSPYLLTVSLVFVAMGCWKLYIKPKMSGYKQSIDASLESNNVKDKIILWATVAIVTLVLLYPHVLPIILEDV